MSQVGNNNNPRTTQDVDRLASNMHTQSAQGRYETALADFQNQTTILMDMIATLRAMEPPARKEGESDADFGARMDAYRNKVNTQRNKINAQSQKVAQAEAVAQQRFNEIPAAMQKDYVEGQKKAEQARKNAETQMEAVVSEVNAEIEGVDGSGAAADRRLSIKLSIRKAEQTIDNNDFQGAISYMAIMMNQFGMQDLGNNRFTKPPSASGSGIPPVGMP